MYIFAANMESCTIVGSYPLIKVVDEVFAFSTHPINIADCSPQESAHINMVNLGH